MNMLAMLMLQVPVARSPLIGPAITVVSFGLIMYFIIIRPQKKIQTDHANMISGIKRGDEVITEGGLIGTVVHIAEDRVTIKSADARIMVSKLKISKVMATSNMPAATDS